ncbi:hypothetical protein E8E11_005247 [Didymella keratinophila]|nr:hypothetical protein E8E11_005247 [Didymella keratinophila]
MARNNPKTDMSGTPVQRILDPSHKVSFNEITHAMNRVNNIPTDEFLRHIVKRDGYDLTEDQVQSMAADANWNNVPKGCKADRSGIVHKIVDDNRKPAVRSSQVMCMEAAMSEKAISSEPPKAPHPRDVKRKNKARGKKSKSKNEQRRKKNSTPRLVELTDEEATKYKSGATNGAVEKNPDGPYPRDVKREKEVKEKEREGKKRHYVLVAKIVTNTEKIWE